MAETSLPDGMKRCVVCGEPMPAASQKCPRCQSEQNWLRRYIGGSGPVLSALVAVVALATAAWSVASYLSTPRQSRLVAAEQTSEPEVLAVLVTNEGARPGTVGWAQISINNQAFALAAEGGLPVVVEPGKSILIRFKNTEPVTTLPEFRNFIQMPESFRCRLTLGQTASTGEASGLELPTSCGHAAAVLGLL